MQSFLKVIFITLMLFSSLAQAHTEVFPNSDSFLLMAAGHQIKREKAVDIAKTLFDGKVLKVEKKSSDEGPIFVVKILNKAGRVKQVKIHAISGEPL